MSAMSIEYRCFPFDVFLCSCQIFVQMADPFTALMYAVQVMNFLKALIERTLKGRDDSTFNPPSSNYIGPYDENGRESPSRSHVGVGDDPKEDEETEQPDFVEEPDLESSLLSDDNCSTMVQDETDSHSDLSEQLFSDRVENRTLLQADIFISEKEPEMFYSLDGTQENEEWSKVDEPSKLSYEESPWKMIDNDQPSYELPTTMEKNLVISSLSRVESRMAWMETWR